MHLKIETMKSLFQSHAYKTSQQQNRPRKIPDITKTREKQQINESPTYVPSLCRKTFLLSRPCFKRLPSYSHVNNKPFSNKLTYPSFSGHKLLPSQSMLRSTWSQLTQPHTNSTWIVLTGTCQHWTWGPLYKDLFYSPVFLARLEIFFHASLCWRISMRLGELG